MPFLLSSLDGAQLHYIDYRPSKPSAKNVTLVFLHGWPMSSKMYEHLMLRLCEDHGIRCIATDRHGFGKSEWSGTEHIDITYDTFAQDTLQILNSIKGLEKFVFVAASMGCGESLLVNEFLAKNDLQANCVGFIWIGPSLPYPLQTETNPTAPSKEVWDSIVGGLRADRPDFATQSVGGVFGVANGVEMSEAALRWFLGHIMTADTLATERCVGIFSKRDFTNEIETLAGQNPKLLLLHGDSDRGMPVEASSHIIQRLVPSAQLKMYTSASHGIYWTHSGQLIADVLEFMGEM